MQLMVIMAGTKHRSRSQVIVYMYINTESILWHKYPVKEANLRPNSA